jgi:hypothetical protein
MGFIVTLHKRYLQFLTEPGVENAAKNDFRRFLSCFCCVLKFKFLSTSLFYTVESFLEVFVSLRKGQSKPFLVSGQNIITLKGVFVWSESGKSLLDEHQVCLKASF